MTPVSFVYPKAEAVGVKCWPDAIVAMHACFHHVKGQVGLATVEVPGGPKVFAKSHAANDIQSDPQRGIVEVDLSSCAVLQDAYQLLVDLQHMPKALPAGSSPQVFSLAQCSMI